MSILKKATAHWQNAASAFVGATSAVFDQHVATDLKKQMHQYQLFTLGSKIARIAMDTLAEVESEYAANVHSIIELEVAVMLDTDRDDVNMLSQLAAGRVLQPRLRRALSADQSLAHANAIPRKEIPSYPDPVAETISCVSEVLIRWEEAYSRINVHLMCAFYNAFVSAYSRKMDVKMARLVNCMKQNSESEWVRRLNATGSSHVSAIGTASTLTLARLVLPGETGELDMPKDVPKDTDQLTSPKRRPLLPPRNISLEKSLIKFEERVIRMCMPESLTRWFELVSVEFRKLGL